MDPMTAARDLPQDERLARELRARIYAGDPPVGERVESADVIARRLGMSEAMARRAFDALRREGLIRTDQGRGSYVLSRHKWHATVSCEMQTTTPRKLAAELLAQTRQVDEPAVSEFRGTFDGSTWAWTMTVEAADAGQAATIAVAVAREAGAEAADWRLAVELAPVAD